MNFACVIYLNPTLCYEIIAFSFKLVNEGFLASSTYNLSKVTCFVGTGTNFSAQTFRAYLAYLGKPAYYGKLNSSLIHPKY